MPMIRSLAAMVCTALALVAAPAAHAQNLFAPVVRVNDRVVTQYELNQRARFMQILRAPGDVFDEALKALINERIQLDAAARLGVEASDKDIAAGLEEFAGRANLAPEQFLAAMAQAGVSKETVYDFIRVGVIWRGVVRQRFLSRAEVTDAEIDRAFATATANRNPGSATTVRVLLSEIFLPANTPEAEALAKQRAAEISRMTTEAEFAAAARAYSAAPSRDSGGKQGWITLANLPEAVRGQIFGLSPGQVTAPIPVTNAIALFQLRAIEETGAPREETVAIDYARYFIPGGRTESALAEARRIEARVDTCDDLYGIARDGPPERLTRETVPVAQIPNDIALELARLDAGEVSLNLTAGDGQTLVFLMMCRRNYAIGADLDREAVRQQLINQRLAAFANGYLAELKADAYIVYP